MLLFTLSTLAIFTGVAFVQDGKPQGFIPAIAGVAALVFTV